MPTAPSDDAIGTTGTAVGVTKLDVTHYRHLNVLFKVNRINNSEIALRKISDAHVLSLVLSFRAHGSDNTRGTRSVTTTAVESRYKEHENAASAIFRDLDEAVYVVLLGGWHQLQALRELWKAEKVAWV